MGHWRTAANAVRRTPLKDYRQRIRNIPLVISDPFSHYGAHTDGALSWVKNVAVPEAGAPMARSVLCQSLERMGTAVPFGLGVIEGQVHGWRLALNLSLFPQACVFAGSYECGQASAAPERAHGRGDIGAPASGTASLLNSHQKPLERRPPARRRCRTHPHHSPNLCRKLRPDHHRLPAFARSFGAVIRDPGRE